MRDRVAVAPHDEKGQTPPLGIAQKTPSVAKRQRAKTGAAAAAAGDEQFATETRKKPESCQDILVRAGGLSRAGRETRVGAREDRGLVADFGRLGGGGAVLLAVKGQAC